MQYITFDLEWNQPFPGQRVQRGLTSEIIQIGAVKMNENFEIVDTFRADVRPRFYTHLKRQVRELTGLCADVLRGGEPFDEAVRRMRAFCGGEFAFITWSREDVPVLLRNLAAWDIDGAWVPVSYDLQVIYSRQRLGGYRQLSLTGAAQAEGIEQEMAAHDAMHDAYYTALLCGVLDMREGLAHYAEWEHEAHKGEAVYVRVADGYEDPEKIFADASLLRFTCPDCGAPMQAAPWSRRRGTRRTSRAACPRHGEFEVRLQCKPHAGAMRARVTLHRLSEVLEREQEKAARAGALHEEESAGT